MEKNEPSHHYTYYILCCLALAFSLSFPRILKGENAAVCPFVPSFRWFERELYSPDLSDWNMWDWHKHVHMLLSISGMSEPAVFWGETQLCIQALQLSHPNLLVSSSSCCSSLCFSSPSVTILLIILNTLACTPLTEGHHDLRLNSNINCQILILNYYTQTSSFDGSV